MMALGVLAGSVAAATAAPPVQSADDAAIARDLLPYMVRAFALPQAMPLDAGLRTEANGIAAEHLARIEAQLPGWIREERAVQAAGNDHARGRAVLHAVWARLLNELALWHITPGDAAYEQAVLDIATTAPLSCRIGREAQFSDFASRIMRVQTLPPARRAAVLASERRLLERWGKPHDGLAPYPEPLPQTAGMAAVARMLAGGAAPPLAMPPALASSLLAARKSYAEQPGEAKCLFQQWWLRVSLAQGMAPAVALSAFRYGTMISTAERVGNWPDEAVDAATLPADEPPYPPVARRFNVTGDTTITRSFDQAGKPVAARVSLRSITVPGIRGVRPVAFENIFDAVGEEFTMRPGTAALLAGAVVYNMNWRLNPSASEPSKGLQP